MEQVLIFFGCPLLIHRHIHTHTHTHTHTKHTVFPSLDGKQIHVKYCLETVCKQFANSFQTVCKLFGNNVRKLFANCLPLHHQAYSSLKLRDKVFSLLPRLRQCPDCHHRHSSSLYGRGQMLSFKGSLTLSISHLIVNTRTYTCSYFLR